MLTENLNIMKLKLNSRVYFYY